MDRIIELVATYIVRYDDTTNNQFEVGQALNEPRCWKSLIQFSRTFVDIASLITTEVRHINGFVKEALMTLAQYPSGLTMAVMITVLEQKWRDAVRRGEHSGRSYGEC